MRDKIIKLCEYAVLAPSAHNIQPWAIKIDDNTLSIYVGKERLLKYGDTSGRQTWISLGAFVENVYQAAKALSIEPRVIQNQYDNIEEPFLVLSFKNVTLPKDKKLLDNICKRQSNRLEFLNKVIPIQQINNLISCINPRFGKISIITNRDQIKKVAKMSSMAMGMALSIADFRKELSDRTHPNFSKHKTGFFGYSFGHNFLTSLIAPIVLRYGLNKKLQMYKEYKMLTNCSAIGLVFTKGDSPEYWLAAGRAYERLCLKATSYGIAQSTSAATVEAADFHYEIEKMCNTKMRLQAVVRLGYAKKQLRHPPRLSVEEITL